MVHIDVFMHYLFIVLQQLPNRCFVRKRKEGVMNALCRNYETELKKKFVPLFIVEVPIYHFIKR
jgi:hypothetical protein